MAELGNPPQSAALELQGLPFDGPSLPKMNVRDLHLIAHGQALEVFL